MFSYNEYRNIITLIKNNLPIVDFSEVTEKTEKFCVLRHDIEFSIDRAYELAKVENELGVTSTYTVQIRNNTYNALSEKNIELVRKIKDLGHHIGLHQNPPLMDVDKLKTYVSTDIQMLEYYYGFYIDRFKNPDDFTFVFVGSIDESIFYSYINKYLSSIPKTNRQESWVDVGKSFPIKSINTTVYKGIEPKSFVYLGFGGPDEWSEFTSHKIKTLNHTVKIRLRDYRNCLASRQCCLPQHWAEGNVQ